MPDEVTTPTEGETTRKTLYVDLFGNNPDEDPDAPLVIPRIYKEAIVDKETNQPVFPAETKMDFALIDRSGITEYLPPTPTIASGVGDASDPSKTYSVDNTADGTEGNDGLWTASKIKQELSNNKSTIVDNNGNEYEWAFNESNQIGVKLVK